VPYCHRTGENIHGRKAMRRQVTTHIRLEINEGEHRRKEGRWNGEKKEAK
jgi:hypothetical protein